MKRLTLLSGPLFSSVAVNNCCAPDFLFKHEDKSNWYAVQISCVQSMTILVLESKIKHRLHSFCCRMGIFKKNLEVMSVFFCILCSL